jgi:CPA2 family monovalent cation:H+ antiporter-2
MMDLALLLIIAAAGHGLATWLRLPVIPVLLVLGIGLSLLGEQVGLVVHPEFDRQAVELGLAFLLFSSGIELNPRRFRRESGAVVWVAAVQFAVVGVAGYFVARMLGYEPLPSVYVGCALSASSTLVVLKELKTRQQMAQPFGRLVTGVLLLQDLAMIGLIVVFAGASVGGTGILGGLGGLAVVGAVAALGHWVLAPWIVRILRPDDETLLLLGLAVLFVMIGLARVLGVPLLAGAFLAGFALSAFPVNGLLRGLLGSLSDFFHALFFVALGGLITLSGPLAIGHSLVLAGVILLVTPPVVALVAERLGISSRSGIQSGLLLSQCGEFALVLCLLGVSAGHLTMETFSMVALVAVVTMTLTPFVSTDAVTWKLLHLHPGRRRLETRSELRDHVLLLGFGSSGMWIVKPLLAAGRSVLVVDDDPIVVAELRRNRIPCLLGDASDEKILQRAGARQARIILSSVPETRDAIKIIRHVGETPVMARVFESFEAERIRVAGGIPILNSTATQEAFLEWLDRSGGPHLPRKGLADK